MSSRKEMVKLHGETVAVVQPLLGSWDPGQMGCYLGCCDQFIDLFNLLKKSGLTGSFSTAIILLFPVLPQILRWTQSEQLWNSDSNPTSCLPALWFLRFKYVGISDLFTWGDVCAKGGYDRSTGWCSSAALALAGLTGSDTDVSEGCWDPLLQVSAAIPFLMLLCTHRSPPSLAGRALWLPMLPVLRNFALVFFLA